MARFYGSLCTSVLACNQRAWNIAHHTICSDAAVCHDRLFTIHSLGGSTSYTLTGAVIPNIPDHIEQRMVLFYGRLLRSSNVILQTLLCLRQRSVNSLTSLYNIRSLKWLNVSCDTIKQSIWNYNVRNAVDSGRLTLLLSSFYFTMFIVVCF